MFIYKDQGPTKEDRPLRVAAYIRVSTENTNQEDSFETQERYFTKTVLDHPHWQMAGIYADYGISGTSERRRTGFLRLLRHCREGRIDRVLCKSVSRFARNTKDFVTALKILTENGVTVLFEREGLDTAKVNSDFILTALGAVAQEESRSISYNIRWGYEKRYPKGEVRNLPIYGYRYADDGQKDTEGGYTYREIVPVEEEAAVVRRIFAEAAGGRRYVEIARRLNKDGIPAPDSLWTRRHKRIREGRDPKPGELKDTIEQGWTAEQVGRVLKLERYAGDVLLNKTYKIDFMDDKIRRNKGELPQYMIRDHHPAIVSRELFDAVQKRKKQAPEGAYKGKGQYMLSGRLVCSQCGRFYHTRNRKSRPIWFCPSTALNNGKTVCKAQKVYEAQVFFALRRALWERFSLDAMPVSWLADRLEKFHQGDNIEQQRVSLNRQIREKLDTEEASQLKQKLTLLETYWDEMERDYDCRREAIRWMRTLPEDPEGTNAFLEGFSQMYVRAFVLSVTVYSPIDLEVRWFDNTVTQVVMDLHIKDPVEWKNGPGRKG